MKVLHLTLISRWFNMVASGEKREEYREITPYWIRRLLTNENAPCETKGENKEWVENMFFDIQNGHDPKEVMDAYHCDFKEFDAALFVNGYGSTRPRTCWVVKHIETGTGRPEWGAVPGRRYFIIKLGAEIA